MNKIVLTCLTACLVAQLAHATSCGEPRQHPNDTCSDWQCTRIIYPKERNSSTLPDEYGLCVRGLPENSICDEDNDCFTKELECVNNTCIKKGNIKKAWLGYIAVGIAVFGFGTNFVPAKTIKHTANGVLFQYCMCVAIMIAGTITALVTKRYTFYPMSMLSGMVWCLGNCMSIPVIQLMGMGLGITVWGVTNMIIGWASGKFGLMGVKAEDKDSTIQWASYTGVSFAVIAIIAFALIKPSTQKRRDDEGEDEDIIDANNKRETEEKSLEALPILGNKNVQSDNNAAHIYEQDELDRYHGLQSDNATAWWRRPLGLLGAIASGVLYGINFNPSQAMMDYYSQKTLDDPKETPSLHYSPDGLDYVFSAFIGIFFTSTLITVGFYALHFIPSQHFVKKYVPTLFDDFHLVSFNEMFVPAFFSGLLWAVAQIAWFVANTNLGLTVSFPIICLGPCVVANFWGILLFKEIQGKQNFILLAVAFALVSTSIFFTVYSHSKSN